MNIKSLLPIGSVVLLKNGVKKVMIVGIKQTSIDENIEYDYVGVLYPEGFLGGEYQFMFNHEDVNNVYFRGYEDSERDAFIEKLAAFYAENS